MTVIFALAGAGGGGGGSPGRGGEARAAASQVRAPQGVFAPPRLQAVCATNTASAATLPCVLHEDVPRKISVFFI